MFLLMKVYAIEGGEIQNIYLRKRLEVWSERTIHSKGLVNFSLIQNEGKEEEKNCASS